MTRPLKKPNRDDRKGRVMPTAIMAAMLISLLIPNAAAVDVAPPGLRAAVVFSTPTDQEINIRFDLASDDPNQDTGTWDYNVSIDQGGGYIDLGPASGLSDFESGDGQQSATIVLGGASAVTDIKIHAWDGATESPDSCIVQVDSGIINDYDACGELDTAFSEQFCLPSSGTDSGFHFEQNLQFGASSTDIAFLHLFSDIKENWAVGALDLGGDTASQRLDFTIAAESDGATSDVEIFFSEVNAVVSQTSYGDAVATGSFRDGWGVRLKESGTDWTMSLYHLNNGARNTIATATLSDGVTANLPTSGYFEIDPYADSVIFSLGNEVKGLAPNYTTADRPTNFHSVWALEIDTDTDASQTTDWVRADFCVSTGPVSKGGGSATPGIGGGGVEDFAGEGGFGGNPEFPGLNVADQATQMGMTENSLGYLLAGILVMAMALTGFFIFGGIGATIGLVIGLGVGFMLNLLPGWLIVVIFLIAVTILYLSFSRGGSE